MNINKVLREFRESVCNFILRMILERKGRRGLVVLKFCKMVAW